MFTVMDLMFCQKCSAKTFLTSSSYEQQNINFYHKNSEMIYDVYGVCQQIRTVFTINKIFQSKSITVSGTLYSRDFRYMNAHQQTPETATTTTTTKKIAIKNNLLSQKVVKSH